MPPIRPRLGPELAIDSASPEAGVALLEGDTLLVERRWTVETNYSRELLAGIDAALREAGVARAAIAAIAVDAGPGGYGGLRSGVATAQGLALALDVPLAGVSRLEAAAFPHLGAGRPVVATHDPGAGRVAWAAYEAAAGAPAELVGPRLESVEECVRAAPPGALWCGELTSELVAARDAARSGDGDVPPDDNVRSAADLVRLARLHGAYGDPGLVDVVYLRPPPITQPARR
jgi:tRNA threonylcarbamoyl adenosine modification protein YeaZ